MVAVSKTFVPNISIHALREEGDFSPPPRGGKMSYFYPRPPRGGRLFQLKDGKYLLSISIHALREEGDAMPSERICRTSYFYPRPPRGGRPCCPDLHGAAWLFLSTPSARRATAQRAHSGRQGQFLSTPSARRATLTALQKLCADMISIHALREEGD